jgi:MFS family permease
MADLSWAWIGLMLTGPPLVGWLVAYPFWRHNEMIFGNLVGTGVIFAAAFALIFREYVDLDRVVRACINAGYTCWPDPSPFTRYAIYACIGLLEVFALFVSSLRFERKKRDRLYAPEWR